MHSIKHIVLIGLAAVTLLPAGVVNAQSAVDLARERCSTVKGLIDLQRKRDLVARINRGRAYQAVIDQQKAFTLRLRNNKLTADTFEHQSNVISAEVDRFRGAYNRYDDALGALLAVDCQARAEEFVSQLQDVRELRSAVGGEVAAIEAQMARYREITLNFQKEFERLENAVLGEEER